MRFLGAEEVFQPAPILGEHTVEVLEVKHLNFAQNSASWTVLDFHNLLCLTKLGYLSVVYAQCG